ncbi:MAG: hypothetical protein K2Q06_14250, partial [Parvularculaceae bacterium]|nr:hypothetical protein [Parvularculaceae bacterium]
ALARDAARLQSLGARLLVPPAQRLSKAGSLLESLSHLSALKRGFALVRTADGRILRSAGGAPGGAPVSIDFADGTRRAVLDAAKPGKAGGGKATDAQGVQ